MPAPAYRCEPALPLELTASSELPVFQMFDPPLVRFSDTCQGTDIFPVFRDGNDQIGNLMPIQLDGLSERFMSSRQ